MIVQHPLLWCALLLATGIVVGEYFPLPYYLPLLAVILIACLWLRNSRHLHDILTIIVWLLIGCSRISVCHESSREQTGGNVITRKAGEIQASLINRLEKSHLSPNALALCSALVLGHRDGLKRETRQAYARAGISHLLALSGMHLGILYGLLHLIFIRWVSHSRWRCYALPFILSILWGYTLVVGMPVSLIRAAIMLSVFTITWLLQYKTDPLHPLALSAIIILLVSPEALFSISFQLSFTAIFFIIAFWKPIEENFPHLPWVARMLAVSCIAQLGTTPLTLYYFHQLPLLAPIFSVILIPLTTAIIYMTLIVLALPLVPLSRLINTFESVQQYIVDSIDKVPGATQTGFYPDVIMVVHVYAVLLIAIVRLRTR